jgi:nitrate/TMAO reductase-like tetraheme cytochrome c subunit
MVKAKSPDPDSTVVEKIWFGFLRFILAMGNHWMSLLGAVICTVTAVFIIIMFLLDSVNYFHNPYAGIVAFVFLPSVFVLGLVLIPAGMYLARKRRLQAGEETETERFPKLDFNDPRARHIIAAFSLVTLVNILILSVVSYKGVQEMDSAEFCGTTCHTVMSPEYTAYENSPHSRVDCVSCHIGPGASWFVKSKLSGSYQVYAVAFNKFPRPIPTPIENLRPSRETCEQCHWPQKFIGNRILVRTKFSDDEKNTPLKTVLVVKVGGGDLASGNAGGIHWWHMYSQNKITYVPADKQRQNIPWVQLTDPQGKVTTFVAADSKYTSEQLSKMPLRAMDCVDCHNRPTHIYKLPGPAIDDVMLIKKVDPSLPFIKKKALELMTKDYPNQQAARDAIKSGIEHFYQANYPQIYATQLASIQGSIAALQNAYSQNVFPEMKVTWGTYPNNIGHQDFPGCWRCHDDNHVSSDGRKIPQDCSTCHDLVATEEANPKVLPDLLK